jgi:hypothetical protein
VKKKKKKDERGIRTCLNFGDKQIKSDEAEAVRVQRADK